MARRSGLGRGLGALIPTDITGESGSALREVPVESIAPNPHQPRSYFDEEALASLTASVAELGVLQPILVREVGEDRFELIAGERRWRAAKRAGLPSIPVVVRTVDEVLSLEQALVENLHREDLNPLEEAAAYQQLMEDFTLTQEQVAQKVGRSRSAVANTLRLFQLPPSIQRLVAENQLTAGHARALLGTPDRAYQEELAKEIVARGLSVREAEDAVRAHNEAAEDAGEEDPAAPTEPAPAPARRLRPPGLLELEELLADHLDTRVKVSMAGANGRGKVVVEFGGLEDLERIYRAITEGRPEST
ncbi:MAG TPA: ParB/RepB/Spo0J family partition protein [Acidimicrobiales bacterium]|nr:ParB/RepB/Spo0J family partition protein [Acidimicrobiales bacterium]